MFTMTLHRKVGIQLEHQIYSLHVGTLVPFERARTKHAPRCYVRRHVSWAAGPLKNGAMRVGETYMTKERAINCRSGRKYETSFSHY